MSKTTDTPASTGASLAMSKGERVRSFFNAESKALLALYKNIQTLIPSDTKEGSGHTAEEGRYIEALLRSFLNKHLPKELEALSGFILRPATKVGTSDRTRRETEEDVHSTQLDVIIYDSANYPVYERFEEFAIVPPEGVVAIISVKKNLYQAQLKDELNNLSKAAKLCRVKNSDGAYRRGPATALVAFGHRFGKGSEYKSWTDSVYAQIKATHNDHYFDQCVGSVICLDSFSVFKKRPNSDDESKFDDKANYLSFDHHEDEDLHFGLQFLLTGIFAAYHHPTRNVRERPGFTSFPSGKKHDREFDAIQVKGLRYTKNTKSSKK